MSKAKGQEPIQDYPMLAYGDDGAELTFRDWVYVLSYPQVRQLLKDLQWVLELAAWVEEAQKGGLDGQD